jgi:hypothetical protein
VGAAVEGLFEDEWGGPLLDRAPALGSGPRGSGTAPLPGIGTEPDGGTR